MKHKLRTNLLASWGDHIVGVLIGLFLMPFVLNTMGEDQYGLWLFICSIAGYSGLFNFGFAETISRFVAHHHAKQEIDQINRVVSVIGAVYAVICSIVMCAAGCLAFLAPYFYATEVASVFELRVVIVLLGLNVVVGILGSVFGGVIVGLQRIDVERGMRSLSGIARLGLTVLFLQKEHGLGILAIVFLITTLVENIGYAVVVFRLLPQLRPGWQHLDWRTLKECSGFSVFALLDGISGKIVDATDTVIIGLAFGTQAIVPYYVALRLTQFIVQPLQHIGAIAMPRGAELNAMADEHRVRVLVQKGLGLSLLLTAAFFVGACFFGDHVIQAWVGQSYTQSHTLLLVLLGAQLVATPMRVLRGVLFGMGHVRVPGLLYFIEALANLVLSVVLMRPLGVLGIALGTAIPIVIVELFVLLPYAIRMMHLSARPFLQAVVLPQILPLICLFAYSWWISRHWTVTAQWLPVFAVSVGGGVVLSLAWLVSRRWIGRTAPVYGA